MPDQLELFPNGPFSVRLTVEDAFRIFVDTYWKYLPSFRATKSPIRRIYQYFRHRYLDTVSAADIEAFRRHLKMLGLAEPTINKTHMVLSRCISKLMEYKEAGHVNGESCKEWTLPEKNPARQVPKVNERQFARKTTLKKYELRKLVSYADEDLKDLIMALYWTRLRPSDLRKVTSLNVDLKYRKIEGIQSKTVTTKNPSGVPYIVVMDKELGNLIFRRLRRVKSGTPLFSFRNLQKKWKALREACDLVHVQLRDLRRSAATHLLDAGIDAQTVAEGLGHTTLRMLPSYTPRTTEHLKKATEELVKP